jgi:CDP-6-deoxy-D-xylo-4-hexulose-3-dehydrase
MLEVAIRDFLGSITEDQSILNYLYNSEAENFVPHETPVYYSGPYWDQEEIVAIMKAVLGANG